MTLGGIYDLHYNNYGLQPTQTTYVDRPDRQVDIPGRGEQADLAGQRDNRTSTAESSQENRAGRIADLEQVSLKFNREDSFEYIGTDSNPDNLDMQRAISDMQKDKVLQSYQYFVGSAGSIFDGMNSEDGVVVLKS